MGPVDVHLRDVRYFVAVAEELNFTAAAARLFISQPALSKQIRLLEQRLDAQLFDRDRRSVSLTAAGTAFLPVAEDLLARWHAGFETLREVVDEQRQELVVGFHTSVGRGLQRAVSARFGERHPGWRLSLRLVSWADPSAGLADGSSDVGFVWLPLPDLTGLATEVLFREPRWVALPDDHHLADMETIPFGDLADEPFVALPESAGPLRDYWLATDERGGRPPVIAATAASPDETFEAIINGLGVALLAAGNAQIYQRPGLTARPVDGLSPAELAVVWRTDDRRSTVDDFVRLCIEVAGTPAD